MITGIDLRVELLKAYDKGAQSQQAKIDELQKRIDEVLKYVSESPLEDVSLIATLNFLDISRGESND